MTTISHENCPKCNYLMTKPFEYRCPICIEKQTNINLPINIDVLLSLKPKEGSNTSKPQQKFSKK